MPAAVMPPILAVCYDGNYTHFIAADDDGNLMEGHIVSVNCPCRPHRDHENPMLWIHHHLPRTDGPDTP